MASTGADTAGLGQRRRGDDRGQSAGGGGDLLSACQVVLNQIRQGVIELTFQGIEIFTQRRQQARGFFLAQPSFAKPIFSFR